MKCKLKLVFILLISLSSYSQSITGIRYSIEQDLLLNFVEEHPEKKKNYEEKLKLLPVLIDYVFFENALFQISYLQNGSLEGVIIYSLIDQKVYELFLQDELYIFNIQKSDFF